jgi:2-polyprenyl-3-methyl-5-hydroxy-6-metoxy-1,4-benzoquinol methylase
MSDANENRLVQRVWNANAEFWDERMADGNDFFNILIWPAVKSLLQPKNGERLLDVACGNGVTSRRLAKSGAEVVACDFSPSMIELAKRRGGCGRIDYRLVDATRKDELLALGAGAFNGALCNMALMDIAEIEPLMNALMVLLRPGGRFVFSIMHPCFNNPSTLQMGELEDRAGEIVTTYSVKVPRYQTPFSQTGSAMHGQPEPHLYFHRPLAKLLAPAFEAGLVLDALEETSFPPENSGGTTPLSWNGRFSEIPPVLVVRLRRTVN